MKMDVNKVTSKISIKAINKYSYVGIQWNRTLATNRLQEIL
jgi:hypothetical protein